MTEPMVEHLGDLKARNGHNGSLNTDQVHLWSLFRGHQVIPPSLNMV